MTSQYPQPQFNSVPASQLMKVRVDAIEAATFNPPNRTNDVENIEESLQRVGQLEPVHVVRLKSGAMVLADGHRRWRAFKKMGREFIGAMVYDGDMILVHQLYVELNEPKMTLKDAQMCVSHMKGGPAFRSTVKNTVAYLSRIFEPDEMAILTKANAGSTLTSLAKRIVKYCHGKPGKDILPDRFDRFVKQTILWLIRRKTQQSATAYMRLNFAAGALWKAIDNDEAVPRVMIVNKE